MANDRTSSPCDDAFIKRNIKRWAAQNPRPTNEEIRNKLIAQGCTAEMVANYVTVASTVSADGLFSQSKTQKNSREAQYYSDLLNKFIANKAGVYVQGDDGEFSVIIDGKRVALNYETDNYELNGLLLKVCKITLHDQITRSVVLRLIQVAHAAAGKFKLRKFSAMSPDQKQLYVPLKDSAKLLCVTAHGITIVPNGTNEDAFWIEHPNLDPEAEALDYVAGDPKPGLAEFERLIVSRMATRTPEMAWFLAMEEVLFTFVREINHDRIIVWHEGPKGSGKTTSARACCYLFGLDATGDTTAPSLNRLGDCGLLVMDNKEGLNFTPGFTGFVVYLATGTLSLRAQGDGYKVRNRHRPVGVITSIEGPDKPEVQDRMVEVSFNAHERDRSSFDTDAHKLEIRQHRHLIVSALMHVLRRFMETAQQRDIQVPASVARFSNNFRTLVSLLTAYAEVSEKPAGWIEQIVAVWARILEDREEGGDEFSFLIEKFLRAVNTASNNATNEFEAAFSSDTFMQEIVESGSKTVSYRGQTGSLIVTTAAQLLQWLQDKEPFNKTISKMSPSAFGKRLRNLTLPSGCRVLNSDEEPELLPRKKKQRFIGFFEPIEDPKSPVTPDSKEVTRQK